MQVVAQDKQAADMALEYAKNASLSSKVLVQHCRMAEGILRLYAFLTLLLPPQPNSQQTESEIRAAL